MSRFLASLLLILCTTLAFGQNQRYSTETEILMEDLEKMFGQYDRKSAKSLIDDFRVSWNSGKYGDTEKQKIVEVLNVMDSIKLRPFPDMGNFIEGLINFVDSDIAIGQFEPWYTAILSLTDEKSEKRDLSKYLSFTRFLFKDGTLYETQSGSVKWMATSGSYKMELGGQPKLIFPETTLKCYAKRDSSIVHSTSGSYYPLEQRWDGDGGKIDWSRARFDPTKMFAQLSTYRIDMRKPSFEADSVLFTNAQYFQKPLLGKLEENIISDVSGDRVSYPRFDSYEKRLVIKNIIDKVDYDGGFAQHGVRFLGAGTPEVPSRVIIHRENKPFLIASAQRFIININTDLAVKEEEEKRRRKKDEVQDDKQRNRIVSNSCYIQMALDTDTIVHPGLTFKLFTDEREVNLLKTDEGMDQAPYVNNFHGFEMNFELMDWKIDDPLIEFKAALMSTDKRAYFTSLSYYTQREFDALMGVGDRHPLSQIKQCSDQYGTREFTLNEIASCVKLPPTAIEGMLLRYTYMGYVNYNTETQRVTLNEKLFHHVLSRSERSDFDVINIVSDADGTKGGVNATMNLLNYDLTIVGVDRIVLSTAHRVGIFPKENQVVVGKNRNIRCDGVYSAGKFEFFGSKFDFNYEEFNVDMPIVDSVQIWSNSAKKDERGKYMERRVLTKLENLKGKLQIDIAQNKSGRFDIPKYPIFDSEQTSYAYYDKNEVLNKVYPRDDFYFQVNPFVFDSLDKVTNEQIQFEGTFVSAGIFPDFEETLRLQEDNSLGFKRTTGGGGVPAYGGKGTYKQEIRLSHEGLRGGGVLNYLTATAASDDFIFYPDSVNTVTKAFTIEEQVSPVEYPTVNAQEVYMHWMPYTDELQASTIEGKEPFDMYAGVSKHEGQLNYTPTGLSGSGVNSFEGAKLTSNKMDFLFYELLADTADFELATDSLFETVAFTTEGINAHIDFKERVAKCKSNGDPALTTFDQVQYQAYLDRFTWYMDSEQVEFSSKGGEVNQGTESIELEGSKFTSINPKQDSLSWYAKSAVYDLAVHKIDANEVEFIDVADARVFPGDGKVTVLKEAEMVPLEGSEIVANRKLQYHKVYDAQTKINGRWAYKASGKYDYLDENQRIQTLTIDEVTPDTSRQTIANGVIALEDNFMLSPAFAFHGKFDIEANRKHLNFDGYGVLQHSCEMVSPNHFRMKSVVDPEDIVITIDEPFNRAQSTLTNTLVIPYDSSVIYSTFLTPLATKQDHQAMPTSGYLVFDKATQEYRISSFEKLNERSLPGNYMALNSSDCSIEGEGQMQLSHETGFVDLNVVGKYNQNTITKETNFEAVVLLDFLFAKKALELIKEEMLLSNLKGVDFQRATYETALRELVGTEDANEMIGKMSLGKSVKVPDELNKTILFNDVKMRWNQEKEMFQSVGPLGIGNFGKEEVSRYVDGHLLIENTRRGVEINLLIEISANKWFAFNYKTATGYMRVYSSIDEFNTIVDETKKDDRTLKERKQKPYVFMKGTKRLRTEIANKAED